MRIRLRNATVIDPTDRPTRRVGDLYLADGQVTGTPRPDEAIDQDIDCSGLILMAGGIDLHTHIGGGKVNLAQMLMAHTNDEHRHSATDLLHAGVDGPAPNTAMTGYRYAQMGYTACIEPAMLPVNARQAHMEMNDVPIVDHGAYAMLGNDDLLLELMAGNAEQAVINDYVAWTIHCTQALGIKVVNPGGISAFKFNQRALDVDEAHQHYQIKPRQIIQTLARALHDLKVPHPLHVHCSNLGVPGNVQSTLATIDAADGLPVHLTHLQFHSYGTEGEQHFSSAAREIAARVNASENVTIDVGQIMFGQTVTSSGDSQAQHRGCEHANPKRAVLMDIECDAGCGVVPFRYKDKSFVNALQWAIGLELFLLINDPWRVFLTTDHPNGAPFTSYPHLIRLLMDRDFRNQQLDRLGDDIDQATELRNMDREYSLEEIVIMTRAAPARILGMRDRGHLRAGAVADLVAYKEQADPEAMFSKPAFVYKDGVPVVEDGQIVRVTTGGLHRVQPGFDKAIDKRVNQFFERAQTMSLNSFRITDQQVSGNGASIMTHDCSLPESRVSPSASDPVK